MALQEIIIPHTFALHRSTYEKICRTISSKPSLLIRDGEIAGLFLLSDVPSLRCTSAQYSHAYLASENEEGANEGWCVKKQIESHTESRFLSNEVLSVEF